MIQCCCAPPSPQTCSSGLWPNPFYLYTNGGTRYTITPDGFGSFVSPVFQIPSGSLVYPAKDRLTCAAITQVDAQFRIQCNTHPPPAPNTLDVAILMAHSFAQCASCAYHEHLTFSVGAYGSNVTGLDEQPDIGRGHLAEYGLERVLPVGRQSLRGARLDGPADMSTNDLPDYVAEAVRLTGADGLFRLCDEAHPDHEHYRQFARGLVEPWRHAVGPPGLLAKAVNFASAVVTHVAAGMPTASPELKAARLAVCGGCDQRLPGGTCAGCGCNLELKAGWEDQECPLSKWPKTS